jgi:hypothetical protein
MLGKEGGSSLTAKGPIHHDLLSMSLDTVRVSKYTKVVCGEKSMITFRHSTNGPKNNYSMIALPPKRDGPKNNSTAGDADLASGI